MYFAEQEGLDSVYRKVCEFAERFGDAYWSPPELLRELAESGGSFADYRRG